MMRVILRSTKLRRACAAFEEMVVMAQGLGHADRQAPRDEKKAIVALARRLAVIMHRHMD